MSDNMRPALAMSDPIACAAVAINEARQLATSAMTNASADDRTFREESALLRDGMNDVAKKLTVAAQHIETAAANAVATYKKLADAEGALARTQTDVGF